MSPFRLATLKDERRRAEACGVTYTIPAAPLLDEIVRLRAWLTAIMEQGCRYPDPGLIAEMVSDALRGAALAPRDGTK